MSDSSDSSDSDISKDEEEEEEEMSEYDEDDDEEDDARGGGKGGGKRGKRPASNKAGGSASKKKAKKPRRNFFEEEADVNDDEEESDVGERYGAAENEYEELDEDQAEIKRRLATRMAARDMFMNQDVDVTAQRLESRYRDEMKAQSRPDDGDGGGTMAQNANLPTVSDPKLFSVKCKPGEERMLCIQLMNRYRAEAAQGKAPKIFSVCFAGTKGFIYVEARTQQHAMAAMYGIRGIFRSKIALVPLQQMPSVLRVQSSKQVRHNNQASKRRNFQRKGSSLVDMFSSDLVAGKPTWMRSRIHVPF